MSLPNRELSGGMHRLREAIGRRGWLTEADAAITVGGPADRAVELLRRVRPKFHRAGGLLIDPDQAQLAQRRILAVLRRMHREDPLASGFRTDTVLARVVSTTDPRPATHRGASRLLLDHVALRALVDEMVGRGRLAADGRRIRLPDHAPALGPQMRGRADELLAELREAGAGPPPAALVARRIGLPEPVIGYLRASGELVSVAPEIDYPRDVFERLREVARDFAAEHGHLPSVAEYRTVIGASRRYAAALLEHIGG